MRRKKEFGKCSTRRAIERGIAKFSRQRRVSSGGEPSMNENAPSPLSPVKFDFSRNQRGWLLFSSFLLFFFWSDQTVHNNSSLFF